MNDLNNLQLSPMSPNLIIPCMEHHVLSIFKTTQYHRRDNEWEPEQFMWPNSLFFFTTPQIRQLCETQIQHNGVMPEVSLFIVKEFLMCAFGRNYSHVS